MTSTHHEILSQRDGYDPDFVGERVELPVGNDADDAVLVDGSPVIRYTRFSLELSKSRRLCRWVAWNIDGATLPAEGDPNHIGRYDLEFTTDPRIDVTLQTTNKTYKNNRLDRGHVARRADLLWGEHEAAVRANADSFFLTNITPQMDNFNQSAMRGLWGQLENALLEDVDDANEMVTVIGGPVLDDDDPSYRGGQVPLEFWKIFVYQKDGEVRARAFLVTQSLEGLKTRDRLDEFVVYEKPVDEIAAKAGVTFDSKLSGLARRGRPRERAAASRPLRSRTDIDW